jgi:hypothetical protein
VTVAPDAEALLRRMYDGFNARDVDAVIATMRDDVDWPNAWEGGRLHGRDAVRDYWTRQFAAIDPTVTPTAFAQRPDGRIAVTVRQVVRSPDGDLLSEGDVLHVYALRDGLVERMDVEEGD